MAILTIIPVTAIIVIMVIIVIIAPNPPLGHGLEKLQCHSPVAPPDACADCTAEAYNGGCLLRSLAGKYSQQKQGPILKRYVAWLSDPKPTVYRPYYIEYSSRTVIGSGLARVLVVEGAVQTLMCKENKCKQEDRTVGGAGAAITYL